VDLYTPPPVRLHGIVLDQLSTGTTLPLPLWYIIISGFVGFALRHATRTDLARIWN
jgi:hypothetical protein